MVKEDVPPLAADEPETPVRNQLLDGTLRHLVPLPLKKATKLKG
jgi:hypothetical protein